MNEATKKTTKKATNKATNKAMNKAEKKTTKKTTKRATNKTLAASATLDNPRAEAKLAHLDKQNVTSDAHKSSSERLNLERRHMMRVWTIIGAILIFVAVMTALGHLGSVILFLAVGTIIAFIASPIVNFLEDHRIPRNVGSLIALIIVLGVLIGIIALLGPPATEQCVNLLNRIPAYLRAIQSWLEGLFANGANVSVLGFQANIQTLWNAFSQWATGAATSLAAQITSGILPNIMTAANNMFMFFLGIICAYWLAADYPVIVREFILIAGPKHKKDVSLLLAVVSRSMGGYMRGIVLTSLCGGVLAFIGFTIVGQPYAPLMGIITALCHFVPVIGPWFSAAIATVTAFIASPLVALWTLIMAIVAENITDNLISPLVMRSTVQVHPAMSLLAIVVGSALAGPIGVAVSIPISAAIKGVFIYYFETKTGRQIVSYQGALFRGTPFVHKNGAIVPSADALDDDNFYATSRLVSDEDGETDIHAEPKPQPTSQKKHVLHKKHVRKDRN